MDTDLGGWLTATVSAIRDGSPAEVPCGSCTACCTSSQFVHVAPDETDALAAIPSALLFPAPYAPPGHLLLGYDEQGRCPMLANGGCSIYSHRPRACRTYDCRVFAATGVVPDQPLVAERVRAWRLGLDSPDDSVRQEALRRAARYLSERPDLFPGGAAPASATVRAVLAVQIHHLWVTHECDGSLSPRSPAPEDVRTELQRLAQRR